MPTNTFQVTALKFARPQMFRFLSVEFIFKSPKYFWCLSSHSQLPRHFWKSLVYITWELFMIKL